MKKGNFSGKHHTEKTKQKISKKLKGKISNRKGVILSDIIKQKISNTLKVRGIKPPISHGKIPWNKGKKGLQKSWNKGGVLSEEVKLKISKTLMGRPGCRKGVKHDEKSRKKMSIAMLKRFKNPENHPQWKGGISYMPYSMDWNRTLKRSIRERDHYTCQICGELQSDEAFHVHHIDYNKKNCNPNNLTTLCHSCHSKTNSNREYWQIRLVRNYE